MLITHISVENVDPDQTTYFVDRLTVPGGNVVDSAEILNAIKTVLLPDRFPANYGEVSFTFTQCQRAFGVEDVTLTRSPGQDYIQLNGTKSLRFEELKYILLEKRVFSLCSLLDEHQASLFDESRVNASLKTAFGIADWNLTRTAVLEKSVGLKKQLVDINADEVDPILNELAPISYYDDEYARKQLELKHLVRSLKEEQVVRQQRELAQLISMASSNLGELTRSKESCVNTLRAKVEDMAAHQQRLMNPDTYAFPDASFEIDDEDPDESIKAIIQKVRSFHVSFPSYPTLNEQFRDAAAKQKQFMEKFNEVVDRRRYLTADMASHPSLPEPLMQRAKFAANHGFGILIDFIEIDPGMEGSVWSAAPEVLATPVYRGGELDSEFECLDLVGPHEPGPHTDENALSSFISVKPGTEDDMSAIRYFVSKKLGHISVCEEATAASTQYVTTTGIFFNGTSYKHGEIYPLAQVFSAYCSQHREQDLARRGLRTAEKKMEEIQSEHQVLVSRINVTFLELSREFEQDQKNLLDSFEALSSTEPQEAQKALELANKKRLWLEVTKWRMRKRVVLKRQSRDEEEVAAVRHLQDLRAQVTEQETELAEIEDSIKSTQQNITDLEREVAQLPVVEQMQSPEIRELSDPDLEAKLAASQAQLENDALITDTFKAEHKRLYKGLSKLRDDIQSALSLLDTTEELLNGDLSKYLKSGVDEYSAAYNSILETLNPNVKLLLECRGMDVKLRLAQGQTAGTLSSGESVMHNLALELALRNDIYIFEHVDTALDPGRYDLLIRELTSCQTFCLTDDLDFSGAIATVEQLSW